MRANRVNRREHQRRSGQDRRQQPDRRKNDKEIIAKQENKEEKRFDDQIEGRN